MDDIYGKIDGELVAILSKVLPNHLDTATCHEVMSKLLRELKPYVEDKMIESYKDGYYDEMRVRLAEMK